MGTDGTAKAVTSGQRQESGKVGGQRHAINEQGAAFPRFHRSHSALATRGLFPPPLRARGGGAPSIFMVFGPCHQGGQQLLDVHPGILIGEVALFIEALGGV